jgi:hypothetical protein
MPAGAGWPAAANASGTLVAMVPTPCADQDRLAARKDAEGSSALDERGVHDPDRQHRAAPVGNYSKDGE